MSARVYTIPSGVPFLKALAQGLIERHPVTADPFALAEVTVFLPTRRALRGLEEAFIEVQEARGQKALLLPRMRALGDADEEELALAAEGGADDAAIPPAVPPLHRRLRLAELLMHARGIPLTEALAWAKSLARFLDEALIEEADLKGLESVVPAELAEHFQVSLEFIRILTDHWAGILAGDGYIEAADRRARLMAGEVERWRKAPPKALYIAGSTGSIPATARLMAAALHLPAAALILPGLDRRLEEAAWVEAGESHPQYGLKRLLEELKVPREGVEDWPYTEGLERAHEARTRLLSEALRPAPTTDSWARSLAGLPLGEALAGFQLCIARDEAEEARAIALAMRQVLEHARQSAALVTPDRSLARRVSAELKRWDIEVDDSAGIPLAQTGSVAFLRLLIEAESEEFAPIPLLALLKHPLARLGLDEADLASGSAQLERLALRGPRPAPGFAGLRKRIEEERDERGEQDSDEASKARLGCAFGAASELVDRLESALAPLTELWTRGTASLVDWAGALSRAAERAGDGAAIWQGEAGEAAADLLRALKETPPREDLTLSDFTALLDAALEARVLRPRRGLHPRLFIWGPLEARLQSADLIILGGLNEGTWPAHIDEGPWASRAMRTALGLSTAERRIGLAAHDFQELASAPRVLLTAAQKRGGSPVLPSRWLMRLDNFLTGQNLEREPLTDWARVLDEPKGFKPADRPKPKPPQSVRPRKFSITEIKTLRRDPYAIYAKHILKLKPLDPIDQDAGPKLRGILFHKVLEEFCAAFLDALPEDALGELLAIGEARLTNLGLDPETHAIWRARLARAAAEFIEWEEGERAASRIAGLEARGEIELPLRLSPPALLTGRIDRIDKDQASGALTIIDYKTGRPPSKSMVEAMLDPQLPLGGLLARQGALLGVDGSAVETLVYLNVGGGSGKVEALRLNNGVGALIDKAAAGLIALLNKYDDPSTAYFSWAIPQYTTDRGDYDLLARTREWRIEEGAEE